MRGRRKGGAPAPALESRPAWLPSPWPPVSGPAAFSPAQDKRRAGRGRFGRRGRVEGARSTAGWELTASGSDQGAREEGEIGPCAKAARGLSQAKHATADAKKKKRLAIYKPTIDASHAGGGAGQRGRCPTLRRSICQRAPWVGSAGAVGARRRRGSGVRAPGPWGEYRCAAAHRRRCRCPACCSAAHTLGPVWPCFNSLYPPQCCYNQRTYTTHPWRLRDAATGELLAEYVGETATLTLLPGGGVRCKPGLHRPPPAEIEDPRWGGWRLRGAAAGAISVLAFDCVCDEAVSAAEHVVEVGRGRGVQRGQKGEGTCRTGLRMHGCGPDNTAHAAATPPARCLLLGPRGCHLTNATAAATLSRLLPPLLQSMLRDADPAVVAALVDAGADLAIIGRGQVRGAHSGSWRTAASSIDRVLALAWQCRAPRRSSAAVVPFCGPTHERSPPLRLTSSLRPSGLASRPPATFPCTATCVAWPAATAAAATMTRRAAWAATQVRAAGDAEGGMH